MKTFTARFAHLAELPSQKQGDIIYPREKVGRMGTTGQSRHNHLHIDVIESFIHKIVRLEEIGYEFGKSYAPNIRQLNYFIDNDLFNIMPVITTYFYDPDYKAVYNKDHPAYDLVPIDRHETDKHFDIFWNRSMSGIVLKTGFDPIGYGYYILIGFET